MTVTAIATTFADADIELAHESIVLRTPVALLTMVPARPTKILPLLDGIDVVACTHPSEIPRDANTVLLCGREAVRWFRPDLLIEQVHGTVFLRDDRVWMTSLHPSDHPTRIRRDDVVEAVEGIRFLLSGDLLPVHLLGERCIVGCGGWIDHYDPEGAPFCTIHWGKRAKTPTERERARRKVLAVKVKAARKRAAQKKQGEMTL